MYMTMYIYCLCNCNFAWDASFISMQTCII